jgi:hypothetical protein
MELATQLVALKEGTDQLNFVERIHELLIPFEYTKLDKIIEIPFTVTEGEKAHFKMNKLQIRRLSAEIQKQAL